MRKLRKTKPLRVKPPRRSTGEWSLLKIDPLPPEPTPAWVEPWTDVPVTAENVELACELTLLFMLWHIPERTLGEWYRTATDLAWQFPMGGYRNVFFWSVRTMAMEKPGSLDEFRAYMEWKTGEFATGRIRREGKL